MWNFNMFYCSKDTIVESISKGLQNYELRNIPILLTGDSGTKEQEIAIEINDRGEITDLFFSLQQFQFKSIMNSGNSVIEDTQVNIIKNFLENMKTAYVRKDIDFIENIFSDKALIIVGKKVQQTTQKSLDMPARTEHVFDENSTQFKKLTKAQYIANLRNVFRGNKNIDVEFDNIEIVRHRKRGYESYYGVRLVQDWKTDNYSDVGYLFFIIEFRDNDNPLIWVRAWQDIDTEDWQLVKTSDFTIKKQQ